MSQGFTVKQTQSKISSGEHHHWYTSTFSKQTDVKGILYLHTCNTPVDCQDKNDFIFQKEVKIPVYIFSLFCLVMSHSGWQP